MGKSRGRTEIDSTTSRRPGQVPAALRLGAALLAAMALITYGWLAVRAYPQWSAIREVERLGGRVDFDELPPQAFHRLVGRANAERLFGTINRLLLGYSIATDYDVARLAKLGPLSQVRIVDLRQARVTDASGISLSAFSQLEHLYLDGTDISDAGLRNMVGLTRLQSLGLNGTRVTDAGLATLNLSLAHLHLSGKSVSGAGLIYLLRLPRLASLELDSIEGLNEHIPVLGRARHLRQLTLVGDQVNDATLAQVKKLTDLLDLRLIRSQVTDKGLRQLRGSTGLRQLQIEQGQVTERGVEELQRSLPDLEIVFVPLTARAE